MPSTHKAPIDRVTTCGWCNRGDQECRLAQLRCTDNTWDEIARFLCKGCRAFYRGNYRLLPNARYDIEVVETTRITLVPVTTARLAVRKVIDKHP